MGGFGGGFQPFFGAPGASPLFSPAIDRAGGAIRRGGRQYQNNARAGPYDRPGQQPRPQRWGENSGRLSPPSGRPRGPPSAGGRWGDGAASGGTVAPREAVQGRSLKSYEDLDAVEGAGSGELNY